MNLRLNSKTGNMSFLVFIVLMICIIVYRNIIGHQFQRLWDDQWVAVNWYTENGLTLTNLKDILFDYYKGQYAPVNQLYYTTLFHWFGYDARVFHVMGLVIHLANVLLVYQFILAFLKATKIVLSKDSGFIALMTCLIFAVHPMLVESVAWIAASKVLLYAFFYLLALISYLKYVSTGSKRFYFYTIVAFVLSFLGKEQAVTLPVALAFLDYLIHKKITVHSLVEKIPMFFLSLLFAYVTMASQSSFGQGVLTGAPQFPFYHRIIFCCYSVIEYLVKCLLPIKLSYVYPFPNLIGEAVPSRFYMYPAILLAIVFGLWKYLKQRWLLFSFGFFLIHLGVALHIVPLSRFAIVADRYVYVSSIAIFFLIAYAVSYLANRFRKSRALIYILFSVYVLALSVYSNYRNLVWHDTTSLKKEVREIIMSRPDYDKLLKRGQK
jgi:hypothetical protein